MSFFYLSPVRGDIPVYLLETIVFKRMDCLRHIYKEKNIIYNEFIIDGSLYDNVGHFMLCVMGILGEDNGFMQFLLKVEHDLFTRRLESLTAYDMRCFARRLLKSVNKYDNTPSFIAALQILCRHLTIKALAQHLCNPIHDTACCTHNIEIHFKHCLSFVARRQVELKNGMAFVPCGKWKQYLSHLFYTNLKYRLQNTDLDPLKKDPRIMELLHKFKSEIVPKPSSSQNVLLCKDVDSATRLFPPCMLNLHRSLRYKHRLSHTQRFYYSLFLKDIGMPVEEAIEFWRAEYRKSPNGHHSCGHTWERDEKKFLYGIRHMYGLEGARKSYTSVNCKRIQSETSCSEGGCPFKNFDEQKMINLLPNCTDEILSQINIHKRMNRLTSACIVYMNKESNEETDCDNSFSFTPVKYYTLSNNLSPHSHHTSRLPQ